ncbi:MAG: hypothetical protein KKA55_06095 [Proteobacteria bacterium]|nr:hypothetical protein [Pseudomonadota bacterium]MBU1595091.1 hypothetical protein [Pseudomonadota bacterium]
MELRNTVEYLYYAKMLKWERSAPPLGHQALLDGTLAKNTQIERLLFILRLIAAGNEDKFYNCIAVYNRHGSGNSYISKNTKWMRDVKVLSNGWLLEGTLSLPQKQDMIQSLTKCGVSPALVACVDDFIEGKSIAQLAPNGAELLLMLSKMRDRNEIDDSEYTALASDIA